MRARNRLFTPFFIRKSAGISTVFCRTTSRGDKITLDQGLGERAIPGSASGQIGFDLLVTATCPHCWHEFRPEDALWISEHLDLNGDAMLGKDAKPRFLPARFTTRCEAIDPRGEPCQQLACPSCSLVIPRELLQRPPIIVSTIGGPASGKSNFLAAMTHELRRDLPTAFSLVYTDADPGINAVLMSYESQLFDLTSGDHPTKIEKTQLTSDLYRTVMIREQPVWLPKPFLFTIKPYGDHPMADRADAVTRTICLYDNAGEHFLAEGHSAQRPGTRHLERSQFLMFLFDPTQDSVFRAKCRNLFSDPQLSLPSRTETSQASVLNEAGLRVRRFLGRADTQKLDQPLLVVVTKADIWCSLIKEDLLVPPYRQALVKGQPRQVLDLSRVERVSALVRQLLRQIAPEFVGIAESLCPQVIYFPASALGRSPLVGSKGGDGTPDLVIRPSEVKPRWVTAPMVTALALWGRDLIWHCQSTRPH